MNLWGIIKGLLIKDQDDKTKQLSLEVDPTSTTNTRTTVKSAQTADRTLNLPDADDTLVGRATTDTLTNKTIDGDDNTLQDISITSLKTEAADAGKFILRDGLGAVQSGNTVPSGTVVGDSDTQTLTNKTIDGTSATGTNTVTADMSDMTYDNSTSGLTATDGQAAMDEVEGRVDTVEANKLDGPGTHADNVVMKSDGVDTNDMQATGVTIDDLNNITGVNDLTVGGNLTVEGTTTTLNTATLDVEDTNITVNNNGNDASAEGAGLTVERTGTDGSLVYEDALASKFKIGAVGAEVEVADVSTAQTMTNKDLSDPTNNIDTASADSLTRATGNQQVVTIPDTASPDDIVLEDHPQVITNKDYDGGTASDSSRLTVPKAGTTALNATTDKEATLAYDTDLQALVVNDGTQWNEVSSDPNTAINYISNPNAETGTTGWNLYDDASGSAPIDGTGGVGAFPFGTGDTLRGNASFLLSNGTTSKQGAGVSTDFAVDPFDVQKTLEVSFDYWHDPSAAGTYVTGDMVVFVYDIDNATLIGAVNNGNDGKISASAGNGSTFVGTFAATDSSNYRLILHMASGTTEDFQMSFDRVKVGPLTQFVGSVPNEIQTKYLTADTSLNTTLGDLTYNDLEIGATYQLRGQIYYVLDFGTANPNASVQILNGATSLAVIAPQILESTDTQADGIYAAVNFTFIATSSTMTFVTSSMGTGAEIRGNSTFSETFMQLEKRNDLKSNLVSSEQLAVRTVHVSGSDNGNQAITAAVTPVTFNEVRDTHDAWDGSTFTAPMSGYYAAKGFVSVTSGLDFTLDMYVNGVLDKSGGDVDVSMVKQMFNWQGYLNEGDTLQVRINATVNLATSTRFHWIEINSMPDFTVFGNASVGQNIVVNPNEIETKILSADVTSDGAIGDLTFTGLEVGATYEYRGKFYTSLDAGSPDTDIIVNIFNGATLIDVGRYRVSEATDSVVDYCTLTPNRTFVATDSTLTFNAAGATTANRFLGNGADDQTFVQLEKRNDLETNVLNNNQLNITTDIVKASLNTASHTNNGNWQKIIFDVVDVNTSNSYDSITGLYTVPRNGKYMISTSVSFVGNATGSRYTRVYVNGIEGNLLDGVDAASVNQATMAGSTILSLEQGDTVEIRAFQSSGGTLAYAALENDTFLAINEIPDFTAYGVSQVEQAAFQNITPWQPYDVEITSSGAAPAKGGSISADQGFWRRVGDSIEIQYDYQQGSTGTAGTGSYSFSLPPGIVADTSKMELSGNFARSTIGSASALTTGVSGSGQMRLIDSTHFSAEIDAESTGTHTLIGGTHFSLGGSDVRYSMSGKFPVVGWEATNFIQNTQLNVQTACTSANIKQPTGTLTGAFNTTVFPSVDIDTHSSYNTSTGIWTAPRAGKIKVAANIELLYSSQSNITNGVEVINLNTGQKVRGRQHHVGAFTAGEVTCDGIIEVSKDDQVSVQAFTGATGASYGFSFEGSSFSISYLPDFTNYGVINSDTEYREAVYLDSTGNLNSPTTFVAPGPSAFDLELDEGTWVVGYMVNMAMESLGDTGNMNVNAALFLDAVQVTGTQCYVNHQINSSTQGAYTTLTQVAQVNVTGTQDLELKFQAQKSATNLRTRMLSVNWTGALGGSDTDPKIWALKIK